jgi:hypothetical protein
MKCDYCRNLVRVDPTCMLRERSKTCEKCRSRKASCRWGNGKTRDAYLKEAGKRERGEPMTKRARIGSVEIVGREGEDTEPGPSTPKKTRTMPKRGGKGKAKEVDVEENDREYWEASIRGWEGRMRVAEAHAEFAKSKIREIDGEL